MTNLGNAWHLPTNPEPPRRQGMRDPVFPTALVETVTIATGNQFSGPGNFGNQIQDGSLLLFRRATDATWTSTPLFFNTALANNKYYTGQIPTAGFASGETIQYYLRIAYDDHDTTFLQSSSDDPMASVATADEQAAQDRPFAFTIEPKATRGEWGEPFALDTVGIHAHLLPTGEVLMWGRRSDPSASLDEQACVPFLWDPGSQKTRPTKNRPTLRDGTPVNLFCSGHTFLPDGRLFVVGGHKADSVGVNQAAIYDPTAETWSAQATMNAGRWYPTALTLADGSVLVLSGSVEAGHPNFTPQVWDGKHWLSLNSFPDTTDVDPHNPLSFPLFPRVHLTSDGRVFMSGSQATSWFLDVTNGGTWTPAARRDKAQRDYAPSVMYGVDQVLYIGGGNDGGTHVPTAQAETIDLGDNRGWQSPAQLAMHFPRRQHNATLLPDGSVLVTGGTRGGGGPNNGFNDLTLGNPVHVAELWQPATGEWTVLAAEAVDRCYHSTAVLLPDATVLSAGGGEYRPTTDPNDPGNPPEDSHRDAQIFVPPYLFDGDQLAPRPEITAAPSAVSYGSAFEVRTPQADQIDRASLVKLSSVTHSFNMSQHISFLTPNLQGGKLMLTAPESPNVCPPGHYLLFVLNARGVPSVGRIVKLSQTGAPRAVAARIRAAVPRVSRKASKEGHFPSARERHDAVLKAAKGQPVVIGITGTCPYGIGACWGGAHEALMTLDDVEAVDPIPNPQDSTALVFLKERELPPLERWRERFYRMVNGSYNLRGVEVSLDGNLEIDEARLVLAGRTDRPRVELVPLLPAAKVQWDPRTGRAQAATPDECAAYERLARQARRKADREQAIVTGPLEQANGAFRMQVRAFAWTPREGPAPAST